MLAYDNKQQELHSVFVPSFGTFYNLTVCFFYLLAWLIALVLTVNAHKCFLRKKNICVVLKHILCSPFTNLQWSQKLLQVVQMPLHGQLLYPRCWLCAASVYTYI